MRSSGYAVAISACISQATMLPRPDPILNEPSPTQRRWRKSCIPAGRRHARPGSELRRLPGCRAFRRVARCMAMPYAACLHVFETALSRLHSGLCLVLSRVSRGVVCIFPLRPHAGRLLRLVQRRRCRTGPSAGGIRPRGVWNIHSARSPFNRTHLGTCRLFTWRSTLDRDSPLWFIT